MQNCYIDIARQCACTKLLSYYSTYYSTPKIQHGGDPPSWIVTPNCKNAIFSTTKQSRDMISIGRDFLETEQFSTLYWVFQSIHYWIHKIQDG